MARLYLVPLLILVAAILLILLYTNSAHAILEPDPGSLIIC